METVVVAVAAIANLVAYLLAIRHLKKWLSGELSLKLRARYVSENPLEGSRVTDCPHHPPPQVQHKRKPLYIDGEREYLIEQRRLKAIKEQDPIYL